MNFVALLTLLIAAPAYAEIGQPPSIKHPAETIAPTATPSPRGWPGKTVMHICYPVTPLVARGCRRMRQSLKAKTCAGGYDVIELNHPTKKELRDYLKSHKLPAHLPVIVDGSGSGSHGTAFLSRGPASPIHEETSRKALDELTATLNQFADHPSIWRATCASNEACLPSEACTGAACSNTAGNEIKNLLCSETAFRKTDRNADGFVEMSELGAHYCADALSGSVVALDYRLLPVAGEKKLAQLVPNRIVKDGGGLSEEIARLRRNDPSRSYSQSYVGQIYRLEYTDGQGSRQKIYLSDAFDSPKEARLTLTQRDDRYPKDCTKIVGTKARKCSASPAAKLYSITSRAPQVPCLRAIETDPDFRLYSPHQRTGQRALATSPRKAKIR